MGRPNKKEEYERMYPKGTVIELISPILDPYSPKPKGARFRVELIDDALQLHGSWLPPESGSLAVDIEYNSFRVVTEE